MRTTIFVPASRRRVRGGRSRGETEHVDRALEQAVANGYQEREVQQAIRNADVLELAGDLDDPRVQLAADAEHDERHHSADDKPNGDLQTPEEWLDADVDETHERGHHRVRDEAIEPPVDDLGLNQHLAE